MTRASVFAGLLVLLSQPSGAQTSLRPSIEHSVAAMCLKADVDGDSYRPYVCEPTCDQLATDIASLGPSLTCKEPSPGDFHVRSEQLVDLFCRGHCSVGFAPCTSNTQCPPNTCSLFGFCTVTGDICNPAPCPVINNFCVTDGICNRPQNPFGYCGSDADCPAGYSCSVSEPGGGKTCGKTDATCGSPGEPLPSAILCDAAPLDPILQLLGVSQDLASPSAVHVIRTDTSTLSINHGDAQECLSLIEAVTGEPCSSGP